jgi:hypothetical protein
MRANDPMLTLRMPNSIVAALQAAAQRYLKTELLSVIRPEVALGLELSQRSIQREPHTVYMSLKDADTLHVEAALANTFRMQAEILLATLTQLHPTDVLQDRLAMPQEYLQAVDDLTTLCKLYHALKGEP